VANPISLLQKYLFSSKGEKLRNNLTFPLKDPSGNATPRSTQIWLIFTGYEAAAAFSQMYTWIIIFNV